MDYTVINYTSIGGSYSDDTDNHDTESFTSLNAVIEPLKISKNSLLPSHAKNQSTEREKETSGMAALLPLDFSTNIHSSACLLPPIP